MHTQRCNQAINPVVSKAPVLKTVLQNNLIHLKSFLIIRFFRKISEQFLREVFSGKMRHWPDGKLIKVVVLKSDSPLHQAFIQLRLRMFPYQVQRLWNKRIYSGRADPPIVVKDINAMRAMVLNTPGAIGYLPYGEGKNKPGQKLEMKTYAGLSQRRNQLSAGAVI